MGERRLEDSERTEELREMLCVRIRMADYCDSGWDKEVEAENFFEVLTTEVSEVILLPHGLSMKGELL
jgi:hypothetical protein